LFVATPTYAHFVETTWLKLTRLRIGAKPNARFAQITDLHYAGDRNYLVSVVRQVNQLGPDFVCITGDFTDRRKWLPEELEILSGLKVPIFGVPGNWDYWALLPFRELERFCASGGGAFLVNRSVVHNDLVIAGLDDMAEGHPSPTRALAPALRSQVAPAGKETQAGDRKTLLLAHCPMSVTLPGVRNVTLTIAGHSHGGQVRLPFLAPLWLPRCVGQFVRGLYRTPQGPLYVNVGVGTSALPMRFYCRPEIALIEV
jgi:predicted MPP superfamily phosphohydrolase